ncbi:MAG: ABC transporter permease [Micromonosporaceae bacterium]|nr:ABC transporter permease [Micromonosporaceae bacterium]
MLRVVLAQLRQRAGRTTALLLGVLIATMGFTLLTGSAETSRLQVIGEVQANFRAAYDILVRPPGTRLPLEQELGLVRPNFLSGQFGGITMDQYEQIAHLPGVEVAAPIAMIGYVTAYAPVDLDLTDAVDPSLQRQVIRIKPTWSAATGLSVHEAKPVYVYVTRNDVLWRPTETDACEGTIVSAVEVQPDGEEIPLCQGDGSGPTLGEVKYGLDVVRLRPDGTFDRGPDFPHAQQRLTTRLVWPIALLVAAIDPAAEADLVGLDAAVTDGRYLTADDRPIDDRDLYSSWLYTRVPVLATTTPGLDEGLTASIDRVVGEAVEGLPGAAWGVAREALDRAGGQPTDVAVEYTATDAYRRLLADVPGDGAPFGSMVPIVRSGEPRYAVAEDGSLTPQPIDVQPSVFVDERQPGFVAGWSWLLADGGFRPLQQVPPPDRAQLLYADWVGSFDPANLTRFSELSAVPMETYFSPRATGADDRSRELLRDQALGPDSNPASYLATPPQLLTSLYAFPGLTDAPAPLSAIRVRVAGVEGFNDLSREKVRLVAEAITAATGLDVDITLGSSPTLRTVNLPAGNYGRPELRLAEEWSKKGTAAVIIQAIDRKSVVLFGLILVVCVLFLGNAVSAAVRDRRRELAVLACLGWSRRRLASLIVTEVVIVGLVAGVASVGLALPLSSLVGVRLTVQHALLAIPVAVGLALIAALVPALRAARTHPAAAIHAAARPPRRRRVPRRRTIAGLARANLWRVPGRTALAAAALGIGVGAVTILCAITWTFHGSVTGTLLGDAVSVRVRGVDIVAAVATALLGAAAVADVLYLNIRDRAAELAALRATGWSAAALARLVTYEGLGMGLIGALTGAAAGIALAVEFAGTAPTELVWVTTATVTAGLLLTGLAALVPALLQRRIPVSTLLAEE